jgi:D-lactate dehydrogenase (cytochrome)
MRETMNRPLPHPAELHPIAARLRQLLGHRLLADDASRTYYANDIFWQPGIAPLAIALPETAEEAAAIVAMAAAESIAIVPRGGGMSYTKGYLPAKPASIVIDARRMNRIVALQPDDGYVTVEAGCTWAQLNEALEATGMRTGYWGPLSGVNATIGGALSQNSAFFGSALHGTVADSVLGVTVVLANGETVTTGSGARNGVAPFTRHGGPDLTGHLPRRQWRLRREGRGDAAPLPRPQHTGTLSFGFESMARMAAAQVEMARTRLVCEGFGIDRTKVEHSASVNRLMDGVKTLANVARGQGSVLGGVKEAMKVASAGTAFLKDHNFTLHIVTEGRTQASLPPRSRAARDRRTPRRRDREHGAEGDAVRSRSARCAACSGATANAGFRSMRCFRSPRRRRSWRRTTPSSPASAPSWSSTASSIR